MGTYHKNALPLGYELSEYSIEAVLGHGGFGITYLARDAKLGALVAIKEFLPGELAQRDNTSMRVLPNPERQAVRDYQIGLKNFVTEARALAHFKHPHIVRVLRFLEANGTAYMVMEYEEGQSVADQLKRQEPRMDEATVLRVFIPILNGLHAVHEAKMLHLDIKPENIYLRRDGTPILIDFGSARKAMTETGRTQRVALTPGYAPIEQYPEKGNPGPWTDVYAIGAAMYRCISGKRPDDSLTRYQAVLKYQTDPLMSAAKVGRNRYQPMLLECIDWSMQIYAKDRPQSARELQDALMGKRRPGTSSSSKPVNPLVSPKPVASPPQTSKQDLRRIRLRARTKAALATGRSLFIVAVIGIALVSTGIYWDEIVARFASPHTSTESSAPEHRVNTEPAAEAKPVSASATSSASTAGIEPAPIALERTLDAHKDWVQSLAFSPDGGSIATGSTDRTIKVWEVASGTLIATLRGHAGAINAVTYSPDGKWLATAGNDGVVKLWDGITRAERGTLHGSGGSLFTVVFSPDSTLLAAAGRDRTIWLWDVANGKRVSALEGHKGDVFALAFAPNGNTLASAGADKTIRFWNRQNYQEFAMLSTHREAVLALAYSTDGRWLASGDAGKTLRLWDALSLAPVRTSVNAEQHSALSLAFSPQGNWLAAAGADKTVTLFEGKDRTPVHTLAGHQDYVQSVAFSPDGRWLASGSRDHSVRLWRAK